MTALQELQEIVMLENATQRASRLAGWIRRWVMEFHGVHTIDDLHLSCMKERADRYREHVDRQTAHDIGKALVDQHGATKVEVRRVTRDGVEVPESYPRPSLESMFATLGYEERRRTLVIIRAEPR